MTMGNDKARAISDKPELCALLCRDCHQYKADIPRYRDDLFRELFRLWGYETIVQLYKEIDEAFKTGADFILPELEE